MTQETIQGLDPAEATTDFARATSNSTTTKRVGIIGASGFTGAELLRLTIGHPHLELVAASSNSSSDVRLDRLHPHLRGAPEALRSLRTVQHTEAADSDMDVAFLAVPHGRAMDLSHALMERGVRVVDLSADHRLRDPAAYPTWYGHEHSHPENLEKAAYGVAELHRNEYTHAPLLAGAGCIATAGILALHPLTSLGMLSPQHIVVDAKIGSSAAGIATNPAGQHINRARAIRPYAPTGHRHTAEIQQETTGPQGTPNIALSAHAVELIRGVFVTVHAWLTPEHAEANDKDLWKAYRAAYNDEPFVRVVKERQGVHRDPDPRLLAGTNVAEVGFTRDPTSTRVVLTCALDNITKGAAGAAIQNLNIAMGWPETTGLSTIGLYPFA